jgi:ribosomal protein L12E/L44/L45/RPP1/RPP2
MENTVIVTKNGKSISSSYSDELAKDLEAIGVNVDKELVVSLINEINEELAKEAKNRE